MRLLALLFSFRGRINRSVFTLTFLPVFLLAGISSLQFAYSARLMKLFWLALVGLCIVSLIALQVRRFHDRNRSGWRLLVYITMTIPGLIASAIQFPSIAIALQNGMIEIAALLALHLFPFVASVSTAQHVVEMFLLKGKQAQTV